MYRVLLVLVGSKSSNSLRHEQPLNMGAGAENTGNWFRNEPAGTEKQARISPAEDGSFDQARIRTPGRVA